MSDLISRQAAIDAIDKYSVWVTYTQGDLQKDEAEFVENIIKQTKKAIQSMLIEDLPSAQPIQTASNYLQSLPTSPLLVGKMPSAQPERKTGRWIERNPQNSPDCRLIECSECGNAYIVGYNIDYDDWIDGRDFCMRCGADLRGGSNGEST